MTKGLEAFEEIKKQIGNIHYFDFRNDVPKQTIYELREMPLFDTIEKELKALEIIKDKEVNVNHLVISDTLDTYNYGWEEYLCILNQEEFDLLKEIFKLWVKN